jgi:hypothetical protein
MNFCRFYNKFRLYFDKYEWFDYEWAKQHDQVYKPVNKINVLYGCLIICLYIFLLIPLCIILEVFVKIIIFLCNYLIKLLKHINKIMMSTCELKDHN